MNPTCVHGGEVGSCLYCKNDSKSPLNKRPEMVTGFCFNPEHTVTLFILKNRPAWQKGKLNGIGGKIEEVRTPAEHEKWFFERFESPEEAMAREFKEECGLTDATWQKFATYNSYRGLVHMFAGTHPEITSYRKMTDELVVLVPVATACAPIHEEDWLPNIRWLAQMALARLIGRDACKLLHIQEDPDSLVRRDA